jgi:hypothetical protein
VTRYPEDDHGAVAITRMIACDGCGEEWEPEFFCPNPHGWMVTTRVALTDLEWGYVGYDTVDGEEWQDMNLCYNCCRCPRTPVLPSGDAPDRPAPPDPHGPGPDHP